MLRLSTILAFLLIFAVTIAAGAGPALAKAKPTRVLDGVHGTLESTGPAGLELAQGKPKKFKPKQFKAQKFKPGKALRGQTIPGITTGLFSELERQLTRDFFRRQGGNFRGKSKQLPPGLAKRHTLPPGLAMQIRRNRTLPPGLAKRNLPPGLAARLPALPPGQQRLIVGNDVVLVERNTGLILDVLRGILASR